MAVSHSVLEEPTVNDQIGIENRKTAIERVRYIGDYELIEEIAPRRHGHRVQSAPGELNRLVALKR